MKGLKRSITTVKRPDIFAGGGGPILVPFMSLPHNALTSTGALTPTGYTAIVAVIAMPSAYDGYTFSGVKFTYQSNGSETTNGLTFNLLENFGSYTTIGSAHFNYSTLQGAGAPPVNALTLSSPPAVVGNKQYYFGIASYDTEPPAPGAWVSGFIELAAP